MSQLGRISGPLLDANLNRLGVDLTFRNYNSSDDLLYLDVTNNRIGVNKTPAAHRAEIDGTTRTTNLIATTSGDIATITLNGNTFSTDIVSTIIIRPNQTNPLVTMDRMIAGDLDFKDNIIKNSAVNGSIFLDPSGTGIVDIQSSARVNGDLAVTGNFRIDGDLQKNGNIIVGDTIYDTVTVIPDFTQSLIPGADLTYDLGRELGDSTTGRWRNVYSPSILNIVNLGYNDITVGNQLTIESGAPSISTPLSNDSVRLSPSTGINRIENIEFLHNNKLTFDYTLSMTFFMGGSLHVTNNVWGTLPAYIVPGWFLYSPYYTNSKAVVTSIVNRTGYTQINFDQSVDQTLGVTYRIHEASTNISSLVPLNSYLYDGNAIRSISNTFLFTSYSNNTYQLVTTIPWGTLPGNGSDYVGWSLTSGTSLPAWTGRYVEEAVYYNGYVAFNMNVTINAVSSEYTLTEPTAFTIGSTGIGYTRFVSDSAIVIPAGTSGQRSASPEVGETRWNTQNPANQYLECFDGTVWNVATGAGGTVTQQDMDDLSNIYILVLG